VVVCVCVGVGEQLCWALEQSSATDGDSGCSRVEKETEREEAVAAAAAAAAASVVVAVSVSFCVDVGEEVSCT
jgi:hypothetical protein